jgi:hypothetical protein
LAITKIVLKLMKKMVDKWLYRMLTSKSVYINDKYCWLWPWQMTPVLIEGGCPTSTKLPLSDSNKNLVLGPKTGLDLKMTGRLTDGRNVTVTYFDSKIWSWVSRDLEPRMTAGEY